MINIKKAISVMVRVFSDFKKSLMRLFLKNNLIILYHRIGSVDEDPHKLSVSIENFRKHISYIKENFEPISLEEMVKRIKTGKMKNRSIAVTFDDGYADNLYNALPILEEFGVPATIFITSGMVGSQNCFYWEKEVPKSSRGRAMNSEELTLISTNPLITIGAHTVSHPNLAKLSAKQQLEEINESKKVLEKITSKEIKFFAYPFGSPDTFTSLTCKLVKQCHFESALTTTRDRLYCFSNLLKIPRINIRDYKLDNFKNYLNKV